MSIEQALADVAAAVRENTAVLKALSGKTADTAAKTGTASKAADKPADKPAADDKPAAGRGRGRPPKAKTLTSAEMAEKAKTFVESAGDDEPEFKERRKFLTELAEEFSVAKFSLIEGDDQAVALKRLEDYLADDGGDAGGDDPEY